MAFVDELKIHLEAGKGGDGVVRWLHLKHEEFGGPSGGDGGKGGDVYAVAVRDVNALAQHVGHVEYKAENGEAGKSRSKQGRNGDDFLLAVPIGAMIRNVETGTVYELLTEGQKTLLLKGGGGGRGNEHFKGSKNIRPEQSTRGKKGEIGDFTIELHIIADVGIIGLPNAGKSSLLNAITGAHAKIGAYAFTTLDPNLGSFYGYILADIPGLIEGASEGKGIGHKFLRHVTRTRLLLHLVSLENEDVGKAYKAIRTELEHYSPELIKKQEVIVLTKTDLVDEKAIKKAQDAILKIIGPKKPVPVAISIFDADSLKNITDALSAILQKL